MQFWIVSGLMALIVLAAFVAVLLRQRGVARAAAAFDVDVYRDQLKEVERDLARGVIVVEEAERLRTEVSRRLLEADKALTGETRAPSQRGEAPKTLTAVSAALVGVLVLGGSFAGYQYLGAPGYGDLPLQARLDASRIAREERPGQGVAEAEASVRTPPADPENLDPAYMAMVEQLRTVVADRPGDVRGQALLARQEAALGNFAAAWRAQAAMIELQGPEASTTGDFVDLADMMVLAAGGYVSPEAERVLSQVLEREPTNGVARYYSGLSFSQTGRPDLTFRIWSQLIETTAGDAPWQDPVRAQIEQIAALAGVDYVMPPRLPSANGSEAPLLPPQRGPSAADIEAAQGMTAGDRMSMIQNMVGGLADRLANEGGPPEDWARLIRAYGVLGQQDAAAAIWAEAQQVFPDDLTRVQILQAARDAGVAQ